MYRKAMLLGLLGYAAGCLIGLVIGLCAGEMSFREALPKGSKAVIRILSIVPPPGEPSVALLRIPLIPP